MRILKVWDYEYPWDVRTEKVCSALTAMGHDVHMVARNRRGDAATEVLPECTVHRLGPWRWAGKALDAASQFPAFFNPRWRGLMRRVGRREQVDLVLVRDLPLAPAAIAVARSLGVPVVLDMAEHYAAMMRDLKDTGTGKPGDFLVRNPKIVEWVERWTLERVDHTFVVVEESRDRLLANGVDPSRVSVVCNTPSLARVDEFADVRAASSGESEAAVGDRPLRLVYLGIMEEARGVRLAIEALAAVRKDGIPVTLDLIGDGRSLPDFKAAAASLGLDADAIRFHGYVQYKEALAAVARADAGLIPHFASESWESTIPNKLFDYMSLGVPVISSDVRPVARILEETQAGVTFRDRDSSDLARVVHEVFANAERARLGENGIEAIRARYHFERDAEIMSRVLDSLTARPNQVA